MITRVGLAGGVQQGVVHGPGGVGTDARRGHAARKAAQRGVEGAAREEVAGAGVGDAQDRGAGVERHDAAFVAHQRDRGRGGPVGCGAVFRRAHAGGDARRIDLAAPVQAQPGLGLEKAAHREVEPRAGDAPRLDRRDDRVDGFVDVGGHEQRVGPGLEREHRRLAPPVAVGDGAHAQRIGEEDAVEPHFVAQDLGHEVGRHGGRAIIAEDAGHGHVRGHDRVHARVDRHAEGAKLDPVEAVAVGGDHGERDVGVGARVAVAREVLRGGERAAGPGAPDECRAQAAHGLGIGAEGARVDDGVVGVAVDGRARGRRASARRRRAPLPP